VHLFEHELMTKA